jgi:hypothetical protein
MTKTRAMIPVLAIVCCLTSAVADAGCSKDTDCKGDRVCEEGKCVPPAGAPKSLPTFCCTPAGRLGPYPNPGTILEGDRCYGTTSTGVTVFGLACY